MKRLDNPYEGIRNTAFSNIKAVVSALPATQLEIVTSTKLSGALVSRTLTLLQECRLIYVSKWARQSDRHPWAKVYARGAHQDAKKPAPSSTAERAARYHAGLKASGAIEEVNAKQRSRYWANKAVGDRKAPGDGKAQIKHHPLMAALFRPKP